MTIKEILEQFEKMEVKLPDWIKKYGESDQKEYQVREKQNCLTDTLIEHFSKEKLEWSVADSKDFALSADGNFIFVVQRLRGSYSSRYIGNKTYDYLLTVFEGKKEIFSLKNFCDEGNYDSNSYRIPMMDLYDIVVSGKRKKRKCPSAHVCGSQGYNPMLGDSCPAC